MKRSALVLVLLLLAPAAFASTPVQFAAPNVQVPRDSTVNGARFSVLHGRMSETANLTGFSAALGIERVTREMKGCSSAVINLHSSRDSGVNAAFINRIHNMERGANVGFVNVTDHYAMVDVGGVNVSDRSTVQVGFVNVTQKLESFQFGFINVAKNGFLPVFPFFNFPKH
jgi:hypothetical protein